MFKFPWRNGFAVGLTLGLLVTVVLCMAGQAIYDLAKCEQTANCYRHAAKYEGQDLPSSWWWKWTGDLVSSSDTLAQWIMAFFTIAVVLLVWRTLVATQDMARGTTRVGQAQVRAYLTINSINAWYVTAHVGQDITIYWSIKFKVRNSGHTPARNIWCRADITTPRAEASGEDVVTFDIPGNSDGVFEVRCEINQGGDAFARGLVDDERFNLMCRVTIGFTDVFDMSCGPFSFTFGATKNFSGRGDGSGLLPIHEAGT